MRWWVLFLCACDTGGVAATDAGFDLDVSPADVAPRDQAAHDRPPVDAIGDTVPVCTTLADCTDPPAPPVCVDTTTSKRYIPSCDAGTCHYTLATIACDALEPYCQDYTLWTPTAGTCQQGACTGSKSSSTCFGGCSAGACNTVTGLSWSKLPLGASNAITAMHARGSKDLLLSVLLQSLWHCDGSSCTTLKSGNYYGVYATGAHLFVVGGGGLFQHHDGSTWSTLPKVTTVPLADVSGVSSTAVWAVGNQGAIIRYDGAQLALQGSGTSLDLTAVHALSSSSVYAVGIAGTILYYDGASWSPRPSGVKDAFLDVWAADAANVFVVGQGGIYRSSGASWVKQTVPAPSIIYRGVWGNSKSDVFAVGDDGWIVHFDGSSWSAQDSKTAVDLVRVHGAGPTEVYVGGKSGTLLVGQ